MDGAVEGAGSCDEPAPKVKRSSMFRRYQAEVMAARANTQVRRSSELVEKHRMAEAIQLAAEAAAEAVQLAAEAEAEAAVEAAAEAAAEAAQGADRAAEHAANQAAGQAAGQAADQAANQAADQVAHQADVGERPSMMTQSHLLERARTEAPIAAEEMRAEAAPSVRAAAPSVRVAAVEGSISARTALAEVEPTALAEQPTRPSAAPPAPPPTPAPAAAVSKQAAPHPPEPLAQGEAQPAVQDDLHQRDNYRDELAVTQLSSSGSVHVLARGNANGGED